MQQSDMALAIDRKADWVWHYKCWRIGVAVILVLASGLKLHWLTASPVKTGFGLSDHLFYVMAVYIELVLSSVLMLNAWPRVTRWFAIMLFVTFAFFTGRQVLLGESSCGCFGVVSVSPSMAFLLDCLIVSGFVAFDGIRLSDMKSKDITSTQFRACIITVIGSGIICLASVQSWRIAHSDDNFRHRSAGLPLKQGDFVSLTPENWVGKLVPVVESVRHPELIQPECQIVFYRANCAECEHILRTFVLEESLVYADSSLVFVELDGSEPPAYLVSLCSGINECKFTQMEPQFRWLLDPPVLVQVSNGRVANIRRFK